MGTQDVGAHGRRTVPQRRDAPLRWPSWRYYARFYHGLGKRLLLGLLLALLQPALLLPIPLMVRLIFERAIPESDIVLLAGLGVGALLLYLVNASVMLLGRYVTLATTKIAIQRLRADLLAHAYRLSRAFYSQADLSRLHAGFVHDTERLDVMSNALAWQVAPNLLVGLVLVGALFYINPLLALLLLVLVPLVILPGRRLGRMVRELYKEFGRAYGDFSQGVLFVLQMMDLTRTQTAEAGELERQNGYLDKLRQVSSRMAWMQSAYTVMQNVRIALAGIMVLVVGAMLIASGALTVGGLLSFYIVMALLSTCADAIASAVPPLINGQVSLQALYALVQQADREPYTGRERIAWAGPLRFEAVSFAYGDLPVVKDVELSIAPGQLVALVGPNGAGKSTLVNLLLGFYRPQTGRLSLDGQPYDTLDIQHLRRQMGIVPQSPLIFPGTVYDNITYGFAAVTRAQVERAALLATAHAFIMELPQGYETLVGQNGMLLSGGQRQRLAITRALVRQPALLILDEPTNHLDDAAVAELLGNLASLESRPAILFISHDPRVARLSQHVYRVENGRVVLASAGDAAPESVVGAGLSGSLDHAPTPPLLPELAAQTIADSIHHV